MEPDYIYIPASVLMDKKLTINSKLVYGFIFFYVNTGYEACTESAETMAEGLGVSKSTIKRSVAQLVKAGYVEEILHIGKGWELKLNWQV
ncbi:helix-turn-helix domain-containing protein [Selenomonas ruminantium]|uniref:helix-turn-helix domain-containing protein n=1 Tax=Selenomonas ruminantium TaxID=971 RepID=UPI0026EB6F68|nr:helix-turn-helix domain-containing protein [Selenomonas ruminantium]